MAPHSGHPALGESTGKQVTVDELELWASDPVVQALAAQVRDACTALRWHEGLRRRTPEAALESAVRGARASAELAGTPVEDAQIRAVFAGAGDEMHVPAVAVSAARATQVILSDAARLRTAPLQVVARVHLAAGEPLLLAEGQALTRIAGQPGEDLSGADLLGRPRPAQSAGAAAERAARLAAAELPDLGSLPDAAAASSRLRAVLGLIADPAAATVPGFVLAAVVHGEIATAKPFAGANGVVARALERGILRVAGVDPTGVAVPEVGHLTLGSSAYRSALLSWSRRSLRDSADDGRAWIHHCGSALLEAARDGVRVADSVRRGTRSDNS